MTDDVTWRVPGKPELSPVAGIYNKERLKRLFDRMLAQLEGGLQMTVLGLLAEGNDVAVVGGLQGGLLNRRKKRQPEHFFITFRDGRVGSLREVVGTHHPLHIF